LPPLDPDLAAVAANDFAHDDSTSLATLDGSGV
jgi:hypothetical protein